MEPSPLPRLPIGITPFLYFSQCKLALFSRIPYIPINVNGCATKSYATLHACGHEWLESHYTQIIILRAFSVKDAHDEEYDYQTRAPGKPSRRRKEAGPGCVGQHSWR